MLARVFFSVKFLVAFQFRLRSPNEEKYLGKVGNEIGFTGFESSDIFNLQKSPEMFKSHVTVVNQGGKVFDLKGGGTRLIYWRKHGGANQRFYVILGNSGEARIVANDFSRCLQYRTSKNAFDAMQCSDSELKQILMLEPVEEEKPDDPNMTQISKRSLNNLKEQLKNCQKTRSDCEKSLVECEMARDTCEKEVPSLETKSNMMVSNQVQKSD